MAPSSDGTLMTIIRVAPKEGCREEVLQWFDSIAKMASQFRGYLQSEVFSSLQPNTPHELINIFRFDTYRSPEGVGKFTRTKSEASRRRVLFRRHQRTLAAYRVGILVSIQPHGCINCTYSMEDGIASDTHYIYSPELFNCFLSNGIYRISASGLNTKFVKRTASSPRDDLTGYAFSDSIVRRLVSE